MKLKAKKKKKKAGFVSLSKTGVLGNKAKPVAGVSCEVVFKER